MAKRAIALDPNQTVMQVVPPEINAVVLSQGFSVTPNGLVVHGHPKFKEWQAIGLTLRVTERGIQFAIGDYLNAIEDALGEKASQIVDYSEGWSENTCRVYRYIAKSVAPERRRMDRLTFRHHFVVAGLSAAAQKRWLDKAAADNEDEPWTVRRLIDAMKAGEDMPEETWWTLVSCENPGDQLALIGEMQAKGRSCKAITRRQRKKGK